MDNELFQRMQEAALRFRSGESDFEEIMTPAGPARLVRDRNDPRGFRLDFVGDGARRSVPVQEYPAADSRPPGYPAPLPFLAGCRAIVNTLDQSVSWPDPPDLECAVEHLVRESRDDGWSRIHRLPSSDQQGELRYVLAKDGVERSLVVDSEAGRPRLVMQERRPEAQE
jgi:hypothetical protein